MKKLQFYARKIHRLFSYLLFLQLIAWIVGGATFALLPFDGLVKGGDMVAAPASQTLPEGWQQALVQSADRRLPQKLETAASSQGALAGLTYADETVWVRLADGQPAARPAADSIGVFASALYTGPGELLAVRYLEQAEYRFLGLVDELYGARNVWQASFSDGAGTRLYFDGETGRYLTVRNDFWVFYDAMWRLHIMDYGSGEDFNNPLLRITVVIAAGFLLSGLVLVGFAASRSVRSRRL